MRAHRNFSRNGYLMLCIFVGLACARPWELAIGAGSRTAASGMHWNIMVVPAVPTTYSAEARELFDRNCASCHSKDGRAQTPIARQRGVQDLSECRSADDKIVEQILEGTHNKTTGFKMPPFKERLTRAQIESLVPLVKAFRPNLSTTMEAARDNASLESPRLAGIVVSANRRYAVLEKVPWSDRYFLLAERESHDGITLNRINPRNHSVRLRRHGVKPAITLKMDGPSNQLRRARAPGFLSGLAEAFTPTRSEVVLDRAGTGLVLFLYAQFTGRTVLRSPRFPNAHFTLNATPDQFVFNLEGALAEKGITTIPNGEKFILVVPTSEAATVRAPSSRIKWSLGQEARPELFPGGAIINFANTDPSEVARLYARLSGRAFAPAQNPAGTGTVNFTTQTPLSREECLYAFETLLGWHGWTNRATGGDSEIVELE